MRENSASDSVSKIAGLTLVNALVFQEVLADYESQVQHLRQTLQAHDAISGFADHWEYILTQINYYPIFHVAHQLLLACHQIQTRKERFAHWPGPPWTSCNSEPRSDMTSWGVSITDC